MELNTEILTAPPLDAATVVMLRDAQTGLQVLLMRRHQASNVLGGVYVFPGGKLDAADQDPAWLPRLSQDSATLHQRLNEPGLPNERAAGLFVAAMREAYEECRVLLGRSQADAQETGDLQLALRNGQSWHEAFQSRALQLRTDLLVPWSRWITPQQASVTNKRFDTRFFVTQVPDDQFAEHDNHEATEVVWITPREALTRYWDRDIELAPPQIMSLVHLSKHPDARSVLAEAQARLPPVVQPEPFDQDGIRTICYPGDPRHSVKQAAFPGPSRLMFKNKRFEPDSGLAALLD
ncbi:NUDIX hydrolase [Limnohabitans sp. 2KL-1]|uniref:NUDIX hydrolase n=1 Tax=Limnohabitans sp. 2KL-1 TaxID=1100699 RepID=UPI000D36FA19|nr:NUDIX hydrolase [Limnohabitans sp. 2KL-1]PUE49231.1 NUDIX hydrolase [Limnohabitans sp. 2KL-1]